MLVISTKEKSSQETRQSKHHYVFAIQNQSKHKVPHACHFDEGEILARNSAK
jgi:hypothetical protein